MKKVAILLSLIVSTQSFASFFEECEFHATIGKTEKLAKLNKTVKDYKVITSFEIIGVAALGGHTDCSDHLNKTKVLETKGMTLTEGDAIFLKYEHMNDDTPNGYVMKEGWKVLEVNGLLNIQCYQVNRALPRYEVELRLPTGMVTTDRTYHNVIVRRDSEVIARKQNVEELVNSNVRSLRTISVDNLTIKLRISGEAERFQGELRIDGQSKRRITCQRIK